MWPRPRTMRVVAELDIAHVCELVRIGVTCVRVHRPRISLRVELTSQVDKVTWLRMHQVPSVYIGDVALDGCYQFCRASSLVSLPNSSSGSSHSIARCPRHLRSVAKCLRLRTFALASPIPHSLRRSRCRSAFAIPMAISLVQFTVDASVYLGPAWARPNSKIPCAWLSQT